MQMHTNQEMSVRTHREPHVPADTHRESRHMYTWVHTPTHTRRHPEGGRGIIERQTDGQTPGTEQSPHICACAWPLRSHSYHSSTPGLRDPGATTQSCAPEPSHRLHEHTCGGPALLTHVCVSQQASAPPMGADIPFLECRWGPRDNPLLRRPQAVPAGRDRGPGLAQEEGGVGGARARLGRAQEPVPVKQEPRSKLAS